MPKCLECGAETPRDQMRGAPDELRCEPCARKRYSVFLGPRHHRPREVPPFLTYGIIAAAIVATLIFRSSPQFGRYLVAALPMIWDGELWRLVTTVFPHGGFIHLAFNLYWTWRFGRDLEAWVGPLRFAGLFVFLALGSSAAEVLAGSSGVGLSGVVYGFFGLLYALRRDKDFAAMHMHPQVVQTFVVWFFLCIVLTYMDIMRIGNWAHGAGAVLGWLTGRAILSRQRILAVAGVSALAVALAGATLHMPWNGDYAVHRAIRYSQEKNYRSALYWYEKAEERLTNPELRQWVLVQIKRLRARMAPETPDDN
jgi:membrane associated rhomboid family serine protease